MDEVCQCKYEYSVRDGTATQSRVVSSLYTAHTSTHASHTDESNDEWKRDWIVMGGREGGIAVLFLPLRRILFHHADAHTQSVLSVHPLHVTKMDQNGLEGCKVIVILLSHSRDGFAAIHRLEWEYTPQSSYRGTQNAVGGLAPRAFKCQMEAAWNTHHVAFCGGVVFYEQDQEQDRENVSCLFGVPGADPSRIQLYHIRIHTPTYKIAVRVFGVSYGVPAEEGSHRGDRGMIMSLLASPSSPHTLWIGYEDGSLALTHVNRSMVPDSATDEELSSAQIVSLLHVARVHKEAVLSLCELHFSLSEEGSEYVVMSGSADGAAVASRWWSSQYSQPSSSSAHAPQWITRPLAVFKPPAATVEGKAGIQVIAPLLHPHSDAVNSRSHWILVAGWDYRVHVIKLVESWSSGSAAVRREVQVHMQEVDSLKYHSASISNLLALPPQSSIPIPTRALGIPVHRVFVLGNDDKISAWSISLPHPRVP
jgi:hypothetical protein